MADEYNPHHSRMSADTLADFLRKPLSGDLREVPGIGDKQIKLLKLGGDASDRIYTTQQLIGKFLLLKSIDENTGMLMTSREHCNTFARYLRHKGVTAQRAIIVQAIAERTNTMFPNTYDFVDFE